MTQRVDWELVEDPSPQGRQGPSRDAMRALLGRGWQWKIAGTALASIVTLALLATLTGALVLLFAAGTLLSLGLRKLKRRLAGGRGGATSPVKL